MKRFARRRTIYIQRRFFISFIVFLFACSLAVPALAEFLGPDRTTSQFVTVRDPDKDVWTITRNPSGTGPSFCLIIHTCDEHPSVVRQMAVCGWNMGGINSGCDMAYKTEEQTITLAEATISGNLQNCNLNNGWCTSSPTLHLSAIEPLPGESIILIEGTRNSEAFACTSDSCDVPLGEGSNSFSFWALSSYGDGSQMGNESTQVDTVPPSSAFGSPPEGSSVWVSGVLNMSGSSSDASSGVANAEISLDGGGSWQALSLSGGGWEYSWDTSTVPDGSYQVLVRAHDVAGHLESTASITVHVDLTPPSADLPDEWLIWEPIVIDVGDSGSGVKAVELTVHGGSFGNRKYEWLGGNIPSSFVWDRYFGSIVAPIGEYKVTLEVWDQLGHSDSASGSVVIPAPPTSAPEPTSIPPTDTPVTSTSIPTSDSEAASVIIVSTATAAPAAAGSSTGSGGGPAAAPLDDSSAPSSFSDPGATSPPSGVSSGLLWGSAALAAAAAATAYALSRRKAREIEIERMRAQIAAESSPGAFESRLTRVRKAGAARAAQILSTPKNAYLLAAAAAAAAVAAATAVAVKAKEASENLRSRLPRGLRADDLPGSGAARASTPSGDGPDPEVGQSLQAASSASASEFNMADWKQQDMAAAEEYRREQALQTYRASEHAASAAAAIPAVAERSWWQQASNSVQQAARTVVDWVDEHQAVVALGVGAVVGGAVIILTAGTATPLVVAGLGALAAGTTVAAGTVGLNAYYGRSLTQNLVRNAAFGIGGSLVVTGGTALLNGGLITKAALGVGNAIGGACAANPVLCSRLEPALQAFDTGEQLLLSAQLAYQTATKDPRAAETALELQLEYMDGGVPGNTAIRNVREIGEEAFESLAKHGDEAVDLATTVSRHSDDVVEVLDRGMMRVAPDAAADVAVDLRATLNSAERVAARDGIEIRVWHSASSGNVYASVPTREAREALDQLVAFLKSGDPSPLEIDELIETIASASSRGSGDTVVLGRFGETGEYIQNALDSNGTFFDTSDEVYEALKSQGIDTWSVNEAFLRQQQEAGRSFDYSLSGLEIGEFSNELAAVELVAMGELDRARQALGIVTEGSTPARLQEIQWLVEHGYEYSVDDVSQLISWIKP